jgi:murein L,D-transpeptidase YcbB/YkuD
MADNLNFESGVANRILAAKIAKQRIKCTKDLRCSLNLTEQFYQQRNYQAVWLKHNNIVPEANTVINILNNSYQDGLNPQDYHLIQLQQLQQSLAKPDLDAKQHSQLLIDFDLTLTDAYLLYTRHLAMGKINPLQAYPTWNVMRNNFNPINFLNNALIQQSIISSLTKLTPNLAQYTKLKQELAKYQELQQDGGWESIPNGPTLQLGQTNQRINLLQQRLAKTEDYTIDDDNPDNFTPQLADTVKHYQQLHGLKVTGNVDKLTLESLNQPVEQIIKQISINLDRLRWLPQQWESQYILVNIPSYSLQIINNGTTELTMPVIVGSGGDNKTCIVNSQVTNIELNPYWGIPRRIATQEYLAKIQDDPDYLSKHAIKVYDIRTNSQVSPSSIDWDQVKPNSFPYQLRQDPGVKNALGKLKFIFPNQCGIYLHDTSNRTLFGNNNRSLSHGCVRVGKPHDLAEYLLSGMQNWNNDKLDQAINTGKHRQIKLSTPFPIHIIYQTIWVDESGTHFAKDIYKLDNIDFPIDLPSSNHEN